MNWKRGKRSIKGERVALFLQAYGLFTLVAGVAAAVVMFLSSEGNEVLVWSGVGVLIGSLIWSSIISGLGIALEYIIWIRKVLLFGEAGGLTALGERSSPPQHTIIN